MVAPLSARTKRPYSLGVDWHLPALGGGYQGRRFATTTKATSDLIELLAEEGHTVQSARDAVRFDNEAEDVLDGFIGAGFGRHLLGEFVARR